MEKKSASKNIKLILLGNSQVGKTSLILRYIDDKFMESYSTTLGVDFKLKVIKKGNQTVNMQIWDTGGQERFRTITKNYYGKAMGVLFVYDSTDEKSFLEIRNWVKQIENHARMDIVKLLVSAKCDRTDAKVKSAEGKALADEYKMHFIETSAKYGTNVADAFEYLADKILSQQLEMEESATVIKVKKEKSKKTSCSCQ